MLTRRGVEVDGADGQAGQGWLMRGHDDGTAARTSRAMALTTTFGFGIKAGGWFVQQHDGGVEE
jgi:hypothetical protein